MFFIQVVRGRQRKFELRFRDFVDESTLLGGHGNAARTAVRRYSPAVGHAAAPVTQSSQSVCGLLIRHPFSAVDANKPAQQSLPPPPGEQASKGRGRSDH